MTIAMMQQTMIIVFDILYKTITLGEGTHQTQTKVTSNM
jgi:hypothetical protein